jgi:NADPH2:quinone reductase
MKEAITQPDLSVKIIDSPIPTPGTNEIIIKVVVAAANQIDWKGVEPEDQIRLHGELEAKQYLNNGKDVAGYVHAVGMQLSNLITTQNANSYLGSSVEGFKPGDRVAATNHGSGYAEYSVAPANSTYRIPNNTSFEGNYNYTWCMR